MLLLVSSDKEKTIPHNKQFHTVLIFLAQCYAYWSLWNNNLLAKKLYGIVPKVYIYKLENPQCPVTSGTLDTQFQNHVQSMNVGGVSEV